MAPEETVPDVHRDVAAAVAPRVVDDETGHGMDHLWRVYRLGRRLSDAEGADFAVVGAAALVHDLHRLRGDGFVHPRETLPAVREILADAGVPRDDRAAVCHCVEHHEEYPFAADGSPDADLTIEARVLRDADNLDALGAIGVARAIAFGVHHGQDLYDPDREPRETYDREQRDNTVIQHAREKLLRLPAAMTTETGRALAEDRAAFVETYVERFEEEWRGER